MLDELTGEWAQSKTRAAALAVWERAWERVTPFLAFPEEIRRIVYTTNTVESLHMQIRKAIKTRGYFPPNDDAAIRLIPPVRARRGHKKALGAVKHSIIRASWHMLTTGELYRDLGDDYFQRRDPERTTKRLVAQFEALGHHVTVQPLAA